MESNNKTATSSPASEQIDFGKIFKNYYRHWWWFAISLVVCMGLSFVYLKKKSPIYSIKSMIMVNQDEDGTNSSSSSLSTLLSSFGSSTNGVNVDDEMLRMNSHSRLVELTHKNNLNFNYWSTNGFFSKKKWLYNRSPLTVYMPQTILDTISVGTKFHFSIPKEGAVKLEVEQDDKDILETKIESFPYQVKTPYGTFTVTKSKYFVPGQKMNLYCYASGTEDVVDDLNDRIGVSIVSKKANAIQIDIEDVSVARGKELLNSLVDNYNTIRINERLNTSRMTLDFVEERLLKLYNELEASESKIENYKKANKIVNAEAEAEYIFNRKGSIETSYMAAKTKLEIFQMIRDMLTSPETQNSLLPFAGGQAELGEAFYQTLRTYNDLILNRMELESSAKGQNAQLAKLNAQIDAMRKSILSSVNKEIESTKISLANISSEEKESSSRIHEIPAMEHQLILLYRDREIKNQIYAYLLQKREEAEMALAEQTPVGKVIDSAYALPRPISPSKTIVFGIGFILGLIIPAVLLQLLAEKKRKQKAAAAASEK